MLYFILHFWSSPPGNVISINTPSLADPLYSFPPLPSPFTSESRDLLSTTVKRLSLCRRFIGISARRINVWENIGISVASHLPPTTTVPTNADSPQLQWDCCWSLISPNQYSIYITSQNTIVDALPLVLLAPRRFHSRSPSPTTHHLW